MSTSAIGQPSNTYLQFLSRTPDNPATAGSNSSVSIPSDSTQLSPFAQLIDALQQLQQADPSQYSQVTQQIADRLRNEAQQARADGNIYEANQLILLASSFSGASQSGQLPNLSDLATGISGLNGSQSDSGINSTATPVSTSDQQLAALFQTPDSTNSSLNASLEPGTIVFSALQNSGIGLNS
jgi:hypothetical protein